MKCLLIIERSPTFYEIKTKYFFTRRIQGYMSYTMSYILYKKKYNKYNNMDTFLHIILLFIFQCWFRVFTPAVHWFSIMTWNKLGNWFGGTLMTLNIPLLRPQKHTSLLWWDNGKNDIRPRDIGYIIPYILYLFIWTGFEVHSYYDDVFLFR